MTYIPGGDFVMGTDDDLAYDHERPAHKVHVDGFYISDTEVTNAQFKKFVDATGYKTVAERKPTWDELKLNLPPGTMPIPDSLAHKMELFRHRGHVVTYKDGLFLEPSWLAVYFGQRVMPTGVDPRAGAWSDAELTDWLDIMHRRIADAVVRMEDHESFLAQYCPATPAKAMHSPAGGRA
jgi:hypothetical protein